MRSDLARPCRLLVLCAGLALLHAILFLLARSTDVVSALLSPSSASAIAHLLLALGFVAVRICVLVVVPGLVVMALTQVAFVFWARRRQTVAERPARN